MKFDKSKLPSRHVSVGVKSAPHRSMYYAMGLKSGDIEKPFVGVDSISLYFNKDIDLLEQKLKITHKVNNLVKKVFILNAKLKNKSFLNNAPKLIVQKEKNSLLQHNIELKKLNSILNSIKN